MIKYKKKNIGIIIPDLRVGGAERVYLNLAISWKKKGYEVIFILMNLNGEFIDLIPKDIKIHSLNVKKIRNIIFPLFKLLKNNKIDVIIAAMWPLTSAVVVSWLLSGRKNTLYLAEHVHLSSSCKYEIHFPLFLLKYILKLTYPLAQGIICVSNGVKQDLCSFVKINDKIKVIYNPISKKYNNIKPSLSFKNNLWGKKVKFRILSVGSLKEQKDHKTLIQAFSLLVKEFNCKLVIVGDGHLKNELNSQIDELGLQDRVNLVGYYKDPSMWYKTADLFILSSRWEGFANVIVESLQFGLQVVSTDCLSGPSEILAKGEYGTLVPISNPIKLYQSMKKVLEIKYNKKKLIKRSLDFNIDKISEEYLIYLNMKKTKKNILL
tara:strand:+ start:2186 stop:3319 length:1134 start_codon:yes stop_codon:yes gene_type:complete